MDEVDSSQIVAIRWSTTGSVNFITENWISWLTDTAILTMKLNKLISILPQNLCTCYILAQIEIFDCIILKWGWNCRSDKTSFFHNFGLPINEGGSSQGTSLDSGHHTYPTLSFILIQKYQFVHTCKIIYLKLHSFTTDFTKTRVLKTLSSKKNTEYIDESKIMKHYFITGT